MSKASRSQSFPRAQKPLEPRQEGFFSRLKRRFRIRSKGSYSISESLERINGATADHYSTSANVNQSKTIKESISDSEMGHNIAFDFDSAKSTDSQNNFMIQSSAKKHKNKAAKVNGFVGVGRSSGNPKQQLTQLPPRSVADKLASDEDLIHNHFILHEEKAIDLDDVFTVAKPLPLHAPAEVKLTPAEPSSIHGMMTPPGTSAPLEIEEEPGYETLENIRQQMDEIDRQCKAGIQVSVDYSTSETENNPSKLKEQTSKTSLDSGLGSPESVSPHLDTDLSGSESVHEEGSSHGDRPETRMVSSFHTVQSAAGEVQVEIINGIDDDIYANAQIPIRKKSVKKSQSVQNQVGSDGTKNVLDVGSDHYEKRLDLGGSSFDLGAKTCTLDVPRSDSDNGNAVKSDKTISHGNKILQLDMPGAHSDYETIPDDVTVFTAPPPLPVRKYSKSELEGILPSSKVVSMQDSRLNCDESRSESNSVNTDFSEPRNGTPGCNNNTSTRSSVDVNLAASLTPLNSRPILSLTKDSDRNVTGSQSSEPNTLNLTDKLHEDPGQGTSRSDPLNRGDGSTCHNTCKKTDEDRCVCNSAQHLRTASKNRPGCRNRDKTEVEVCKGSVKLLKEVTNSVSKPDGCLPGGNNYKSASDENNIRVNNEKKSLTENAQGSGCTEFSRPTCRSDCGNTNKSMNREFLNEKPPYEKVPGDPRSPKVNSHGETYETQLRSFDNGSSLNSSSGSDISDLNIHVAATRNIEAVFVSNGDNEGAGSSDKMETLNDTAESENFMDDPDFLYHDDEPIHMSLSEVFHPVDPSTISPMIAARLEKTKKACGQIDTEAVRAFQESMQQLKECGWYWGPMSFSEAEKKLENKPDGAFLVRDSANENYILSLTFKSFGTVHHTRIEHFKGKFGFWSQPESHGKTTIKAFIEQAMENSRNGQFKYFLRAQGPGLAPISMHTLYPVSRFKTMRSLMHMCRFQILQIVRRDHVDSLPLPPKIRNYLKEHQYYAEIIDNEADDIVGFDLNANQEVTQL